ncbi:phospholipase A1-Igamma3 chloroplastic [Tripterygium wilfordii]|uniref:Phospholipase A1-Igamma3 chloroplastic n=1 Tax=Tripterygium wilfordii TaxID=458696 RepID=A0A7J7CP18_TRIWF|nr:phospholipase A1-Igamma3, chloroplastic [Tripterygium wilfordii]KAF5735801.1 phospholipase A1-Igamma3 chloroplastic [Tripterygium wilfordii]
MAALGSISQCFSPKIYSQNSNHGQQQHLRSSRRYSICISKLSPHVKVGCLASVSSLSATPQVAAEETLISVEEDETPLHEIWTEIQGCNNWEGLLDPLNPHLRKEIIRYGEFAQSCYDSFEGDADSKYCGSCKFQPSSYFENIDMDNNGYQISRYLYATVDTNLPNFFRKSKRSTSHENWIGYIAVCTDEEEIKRLGRRDIVIAWRGTVTYLEWICDLKDILTSANFSNDPSIKIESGFYDFYTKKDELCEHCKYSAREQVVAEIKRLVGYYRGDEISITITGHSLGAALSLISAYDIAETRLNCTNNNNGAYDKIPITVFSFAGPRVGNLKFKERCDELGVKVLRVINVHDKVPKVPGIIANEKSRFQKYMENMSFPWSYAHAGVELALDHKESPFLKPNTDFTSAHNLEAHLHLVDGYHGKGGRFCLVSKRDIALINKNCDFLKEDYGVPPHWRQEANKGMAKNSEGRWVLPDRSRAEAHSPDIAYHLEQVFHDTASKSRNSELETV